VNYPGAIATFPSAINDSGAITGFTISGNGVQVGFEKVGGKYKAIEPPGTSNAQMYRR
jgi:hypothetical protein